MKHVKGILAVAAVMYLTLNTALPVFARVEDQLILLDENQLWSDRYDSSDSRDNNYSYCTAACDSVYPVSGKDNFSKIQARATNMYGSVIIDKPYYVLTEGVGDVTMYYNSSLNQNWTTVMFQFRGNSSAAAYAAVDYDAK